MIFHPNFNHHHKLLTIEGRSLTNGCTRPSSMTLFVSLFHKKCHPKRYHSDIEYHMTLNIILSVALKMLIKILQQQQSYTKVHSLMEILHMSTWVPLNHPLEILGRKFHTPELFPHYIQRLSPSSQFSATNNYNNLAIDRYSKSPTPSSTLNTSFRQPTPGILIFVKDFVKDQLTNLCLVSPTWR